MNKTTSFSKILANKNNNGVCIQPVPPTLDSYFAINEHKIQTEPAAAAHLYLFKEERAVAEAAAVAEQASFVANQATKKKKSQKSTSSKESRANLKKKYWSSESNLTINNTKKRSNDMNKSCNGNCEDQEIEGEDDDEDGVYENEDSYQDDDDYDYDLDELNNQNGGGDEEEEEEEEEEPLQFSDHAGLFDNYDEGEAMEDVQLDYLENSVHHTEEEKEEIRRRIMLKNYDIYKVTKKNYKLTFNAGGSSQEPMRQEHSASSSATRAKRQAKKPDEDSLLHQSSNMDESNYIDDENDEDEEFNDEEYEDEDDDDENDERNNSQTAESNSAPLFDNDYYYYYLNKFKNANGNLPAALLSSILSTASIGSNQMNLNDSIMNWSMKLSQFKQNQQQLQQRSQSRSPFTTSIPRSNSSFNNNNMMHESSSSSQQQQQQQNQKQEQKKSTTSWGKLKHSKSSSSNIGCSNIEIEESQTPPPPPPPTKKASKQKQRKNEQHQQTVPPSMSSPSLFKLFQYSKAAAAGVSTNTMGEENETPISGVKTTSFSQLRQRSLSSCAITASPQQQQEQQTSFISSSNNSSSSSGSGGSSSNTNSSAGSNSSKKKSIGIQHPPKQVNQSIQTSTIVCMLVDRQNVRTREDLIAVATRAACAVRSNMRSGAAKASLPDLTFLKDYADDKPVSKTAATSATPPPAKTTSSSSTTTMGNELLKRKTLKSIKRYRQTKQNTEPCCNNNNNNNNNDNINNCNNAAIMNAYLSNHINGNNQQFPISTHTSTTNNTNINNNNNNNNAPKQQPLKSCLKRKESSLSSQTVVSVNNNSNNSQSTKTAVHSPLPISRKPRKQQQQQSQQQQTTGAASSMIVVARNKFSLKKNQQPAVASMFVPYVGYLFTCDSGSTTRYVYYNNMERVRRARIYRQLLDECNNDNDDDSSDEEFYEDLKQEEDEQEEQEQEKRVTTSRSDNDLRIKKSVKFVPYEKKRTMTVAPVSASSPTSTSSTTTTTAADAVSLSSSSSIGSNAGVNQTSTKSKNLSHSNNNGENNSDAPLLQYNALIAMLKSNKISAQQEKEKEKIRVGHHHQQFQQQLQKQKIEIKKTNATSVSADFMSYFKNSQIIDTDSISLASLSESPPSEFKFSDDENESEIQDAASSFNRQERKNLNTMPTFSPNAKSNNIVKTKQSIQHQSLSPSTNTSSSNQIIELSKNIQNQQMKLNQLNLIRNRKKNFHSVLLKDAKLNNLKEILLELKQQQQKLILLANQQQKILTEASGSILASCGSSNLATGSATAAVTSPYSGGATSIIATTTLSESLNVSIELKETIEHLSQCLFEFLKQGLKPCSSLDSINGNFNAQPVIKSPPLSPSLIDRPLADSSTLTLTYSQYVQLWNLIESTMNINLTNNTTAQETQRQQQQNIFELPKEAYMDMFQEINRYASNTNQTYLIDSSINTSQLRRKHHFMVMLMSLKFKFQLFIINLLNYKQLPAWFEYLNKEKHLLKKYFDLKLPSSSSNNSGDSGVGEFLCTSGSSSTSSLSLSITNGKDSSSANLLASLSINSLANVSIFENEEYFNYFHKLLQQFNFIEFNLKFSRDAGTKSTSIKPLASKIQTSPNQTVPVLNTDANGCNKPLPPTRKLSSRRNSNATQHHFEYSMSQSPSMPNKIVNINNGSASSSNHSGVFNLKNISKRLNIKSWFTSSNSSSSIGSNSHSSNNNNILPIRPLIKEHHHLLSNLSSNSSLSNGSSITSHIKQGYGPVKSMNNFNYFEYNQSLSKNSIQNRPIEICMNTKQNENSSLMKHSLSEPSLNGLINA